MKKIKYLKIEFDGNLKPYEIPAFRGAIARKAGLENELFHNHRPEGGFIYSYPLIQYKTFKGHPTLLCIDQGIDEIHHFFSQKNWTLNISGENLPMKIHSMDMHQYTMQVWKKEFHYNIRNWIALNQNNYQEYKGIDSLSEKLVYLEKKLIGNIISFAKGIEWDINRQIEVKISELHRVKQVKVKDQKLLGFDLDFKSNVFLPNSLGLGKSVSLGYGTVMMKKQNQYSTEEKENK